MSRSMSVGSGLDRKAFRAALIATGVVAIAALFAGSVRVMPLLADPALPWRVAGPFARSLVWLALEVALTVGWVMGWAVACAAVVDRGEARVYFLLGRSPAQVITSLVPQAALFACALGAVSWLAARDAREPGRVLVDIVSSGERTCRAENAPAAVPVPFLEAVWLCAPGAEPRMFMRPPRFGGGASKTSLTAASIEVSPDVRNVALRDVHMLMGSGELHAREVELRRLPPLVASASLPPAGRAAAVMTSAAGLGFALAWLVLRARMRRRALALALAGISAAAAFGVLRALDRAGAPAASLPLVPLGGFTALALGATFLVCFGRLRRRSATATH